ncbi:hypothetical protein N0V88_002317 [Collariella sp. IMI 366227]|nr:hypothetical protein N0V88_002317 [Collariella sp. IMI 366227]
MSQPIVKTPECEGPDYKAKLDEAAERVKSPPQQDQNSGIIDKVSQYVPAAVGKMLGKEEKEAEPSPETRPSGPPNRPHHDTQIEEFIKDQHQSKTVIGIEHPVE